jgi:bifunctional ADP-heptose synthase (sugar kinase/adenylyltransferase)
LDYRSAWRGAGRTTRKQAARLFRGESILDTREKILGADEAQRRLNGQPVRWVRGHFDPLLAGHVRRLRECATPGQLLVVELTESERPLLAQRARAELVAALAMVDFVVLSDARADRPEEITERFVQHVLDRHRKETGA